MTSTKPYLVRAFNEWILDNQLTPYLLIDAEKPNVYVPTEYIQDGRIVFNITPGIVSALTLDNEYIEFEARFSGRKRRIYIPMAAVLAIYAKENGQGMAFEEETAGSSTEPFESESPQAFEESSDVEEMPIKSSPKGKPNLRVIRNTDKD